MRRVRVRASTIARRNVTPKTFPDLKADLASPRTDVLSCVLMCVVTVTLLATGALAINIKGLETKDVATNAYVAAS